MVDYFRSKKVSFSQLMLNLSMHDSGYLHLSFNVVELRLSTLV